MIVQASLDGSVEEDPARLTIRVSCRPLLQCNVPHDISILRDWSRDCRSPRPTVQYTTAGWSHSGPGQGLADQETKAGQAEVRIGLHVHLAPRGLITWLIYRVFNIFKTWLDQYFNEEEDPEVLNKIETFAEEVLARDTQVKMPYQVLLRAVQRRVSRRFNDSLPT